MAGVGTWGVHSQRFSERCLTSIYFKPLNAFIDFLAHLCTRFPVGLRFCDIALVATRLQLFAVLRGWFPGDKVPRGSQDHLRLAQQGGGRVVPLGFQAGLCPPPPLSFRVSGDGGECCLAHFRVTHVSVYPLPGASRQRLVHALKAPRVCATVPRVVVGI